MPPCFVSGRALPSTLPIEQASRAPEHLSSSVVADARPQLRSRVCRWPNELRRTIAFASSGEVPLHRLNARRIGVSRAIRACTSRYVRRAPPSVTVVSQPMPDSRDLPVPFEPFERGRHDGDIGAKLEREHGRARPGGGSKPFEQCLLHRRRPPAWGRRLKRPQGYRDRQALLFDLARDAPAGQR